MVEKNAKKVFYGYYILEFPDETIPHWSMARMRLAALLHYAAQRTGTGGHLTVVFASLLSRLRFIHGYAPAAAYAAILCW
ncbi:MAG: hypothetical protein IKP00_10215 [Victivallales bacterium]|nr:hypothetical protein [Victivallales bacterium]